METYRSVPTACIQGDTLVIDLDGGEYPPPYFALQLTMISPAGKLSVSSTDADGMHRLTVDSTALSIGRNDWQLKAIGTDFRHTIASGIMIVSTDFASATLSTLDNRNWIDLAIDALQAAIKGLAGKTQLAMAIDGVQISNMDLGAKIDALRKLKIMQGGGSGTSAEKFKTILPRFSN